MSPSPTKPFVAGGTSVSAMHIASAAGRGEAPDPLLRRSIEKVGALVAPRNVVMVGASDKPGSWSARVWSNVTRYGFSGGIYPVNPRREQIWDQECYPDLRSLPEPPDLLLVLVPAGAVPDVLSQAAAAGARSAIVFTSGFGEVHTPEGDALEARLRSVVAETEIGLVGPNCLGSVFGRARLVTMTDERWLDLASGPVGLVGQSGGVMLFTNRVLAERGIGSGYIISSGNETGLNTADYIAYFAHDPDIKVIVSYLEAVGDPERFLAACRMAQAAGKPVVMVKLGESEAGRAAALAHTGALAGSMQAFDAVAGEAGVIRVDTLDDIVETVDYLVHAPIPAGRRLGAVTLSGAYRGLLLDAAERNGLLFPALEAPTENKLNELLNVGSIVGNPLDGGFGVLSSEETFLATVKTMLADPNIDILLLQEEVPRDPALKRSERYLRAVEAYLKNGAVKPLAFISMLTHSENDYSRNLRKELPRLAFLHEANKGLRALASIIRYGENCALAATKPPAAPPLRAPAVGRCREIARQSSIATALNEHESKALIRAYGIDVPGEELATSEQAAVSAAERLGYPVVLKGVSAQITHKSDAGIVALGLETTEAVREAYARIAANAIAYRADAVLDGVLVCQQIDEAQEVSLGLHRDPEMGPVVMAGSGGVLIELFKDVAFAAPPITPEKAAAMIARTRMGTLLQGFRGAPAHDEAAVIRALVALGRIATDLGDVLESIDINPFAVRPGNGGGVALDALVVIRGGATAEARR